MVRSAPLSRMASIGAVLVAATGLVHPSGLMALPLGLLEVPSSPEALPGAAPTPAQEDDGWEIAVQRLRGPLFAVRATNPEARVNLLASIGEDGVLLSDAGVADYAEDLAAILARHTGDALDTRWIVNTHYHGDHTGGNAALGRGAIILAHARTAASLIEGARFGPGPLEPPALPSVLVHDSLTIRFNGEDIRVLHLPLAHTEGDLAVHFLGSDVLHVGDIVLAPGSLPYTRFPITFPRAVEALAARAGPNTIVVTGHGEPTDRDGLLRLAAIVRETRAYVDEARASGSSLEETLAGRPADWDRWTGRYLSVEEWLTGLYERGSPALEGPLLAVVLRSAHEVVLVDPDTLQPVARFRTGRGPHEVAITEGRVAFVPNYGTHPVPHDVPIEPSELRWRNETGRTLSRVELETGAARELDLGECTMPHGVAVAPAGDAVWVTCQDLRQLWELDPETGDVRRRWTTDQETSHMVTVSPDGTKLYVANIGSGSVSSIDRESGQVRAIATAPGTEGMAMSPDGRRLWVANNQDNSITIIDTETDRALETFETAGRFPIKLGFSPDGDEVWVANNQSADLTVYDARTRALRRRIELGSTPLGLLVAPDGRVFVTLPRRNEIVVLDGNLDDPIVGRFSPGIEPDGLAWIP